MHHRISTRRITIFKSGNMHVCCEHLEKTKKNRTNYGSTVLNEIKTKEFEVKKIGVLCKDTAPLLHFKSKTL